MFPPGFEPLKIKPDTAQLPPGFQANKDFDFDKELAKVPNTPPHGFLDTLANDYGGAIPRLTKGLRQDPLGTLSSIVGSALPFGRQTQRSLTETNQDIDAGNWGKLGARTLEASAPFLTRSAGGILRGGAAPLAENALGIRRAGAFGATPGKAILEETSGVRPSTIADSARERIGDLSSQLNAKAQSATKLANLEPARRIITNRSAQAAAGNSSATPAELSPMQAQLTTPRPGFSGRTQFPPGAYTPITFTPENSPILGPNGEPLPAPPRITRGAEPAMEIAPRQNATDFLRMKREFGQDNATFNPARPLSKDATSTANRAYSAMAKEFNRVVPGGAELNQRIQSLIPVRNRADITELNAGPADRMIDRATRPTGAMIPALMGFKEGGPLGAGLALAAQETLSSPVAKMIMARGLYNGGRLLTGAGNAAAPVPLIVDASRWQRK